MAKRFTDTDKWKKPFIRKLPDDYKIFWLYLCDDCSNVGIWEVSELGVFKERTGKKVTIKKALELFNADGEKRAHLFDNDKKLFLPGFITFQYGEDFVLKTSKNRLIHMVHEHLERLGLLELIPVRYPLERVARQEQRQDMDKDKDKEVKLHLPGTWREGRDGKGAR
jgi:hypothetical protein